MAKKAVTDLKASDKMADEAYEEFAAVSEIKHELALEVFDAQDAKTKTIILIVKAKLKALASDTIALKLPNGKVEAAVTDEHLDWNLLWLAVEVVKDLGLVGIQVGNFQFPSKQCAICGGDA